MVPDPDFGGFVVGVVFVESFVSVDGDLGDFADVALVVVEETVPEVFPGDDLDVGEAGVLEHDPGIVIGFVVQVPGGEGHPDPVPVPDGIRSHHDDDDQGGKADQDDPAVLGHPVQGKAIPVLQIGERQAETVGVGLDLGNPDAVALHQQLHGSPAVRAVQSGKTLVLLQEQGAAATVAFQLNRTHLCSSSFLGSFCFPEFSVSVFRSLPVSPAPVSGV